MSFWSKISIFGAGQIGGSLAQRLAEASLADEVVLLDIVDGLPQGKALDIQESAPILGFSTRVSGSTQEKDVAGSDLVVLTAGLARKPGMSRSDLLALNARIVKGHAEAIRKFAPGALVLVVTNPVDVMAWLVKDVTGFPRERVVAESSTLDSARFRFFISQALGVAPCDVVGFVLGTHGDTMVPVLSHSSVCGVPLKGLLAPDKLSAIVERTKKGGGEIVELLKSGSAYFAPTASQLEMIIAMARDEHRLLLSSVFLEGEYGYHNVYLGVPAILGRKGLEKIVEVELTATEKVALDESAKAVSKDIALLSQGGLRPP